MRLQYASGSLQISPYLQDILAIIVSNGSLQIDSSYWDRGHSAYNLCTVSVEDLRTFGASINKEESLLDYF